HQLAGLDRLDDDRVLAGDGDTVPRVGFLAVDPDPATRGDEILVAPRGGFVSRGFTRRKRRREDAGIAADAQRAIGLRLAAGEDLELARTVSVRKLAHAPIGLPAGLVRYDPDLEQRGILVLQVVFRVDHAGAGAHRLDVTGGGAAPVAHRILVRNGPGANESDNLHVAVRVRRKTALGRNPIVVPHANLAPA